jgi:Fe-S-cluster containining protein
VSRFSKEQVRSVVAETQAVYAALAERPIERQCTGIAECCQFRLTGKTPHLTRGEAITAWAAVKASGRKVLPESVDGACPLLNPKTLRCMIYTGRPFGCRTHFCGAAGGPFARNEVIDLIRRLEKIDAETGGDGSKPIATALREVAEL